MKSRQLLLIWVVLFLFSCLPFCSALGQRQIESRKRGSSPKPANPAKPVVHLRDGREIQESIPVNSNTPVIFHYKADSPHRQHLLVTVKCPGREIVTYARRKRMNDYFDSILNEETAEFSSLENQNNLAELASISVPSLADPVETVVVLAVYFNDMPSNSMAGTTFTILATSKMTHLFTGTQYTGSVAKDQYVYFMVPIIRSEGGLLISLTNLNDDGDADLVISYDQNTRPTVSDHQFASISHERIEIIEINNTDIPPFPENSMSGNMILGVFGKTASSFSLAVAYEDQKMIDLTPGTPLQMSLDKLSPSYAANFKFFHETKSNLQIMLKTFSGEVNLYMTSINSTQNLASHLPDSTSYKWQISGQNPQSLINIPIEDPQACISCFYIIRIEAISPSSFSILVSEGHSFVSLQDGLSHSGELKPQGSAHFELKSSSRTEEVRLKVDLEGSELEIFISNTPMVNTTNYLLKETISLNSKNHIISLKKDKELHTDVFYILFYNPTDLNVSYNFTMAMKSSDTILLVSPYQETPINPYEKASFVYYSNIENDKTALKITLSAPDLKERSKTLKSVELALRQGQIIKARYWAEEEAKGPGQEILIETPALELASPLQTLLMKSSKGKYVIEIANPWEFPVKVSIVPNLLQFPGENWQYQELISQGEREFTILMTKLPAKWYYWFYSCSSRPADLKIDKGNKQAELVTIPQGGSYQYREALQGIEGRLRHVSVRMDANAEESPQPILMYSALVEEPKLWDYDIQKEKNLKMNLSLNDQEGDSQVTVEFHPVEFRDPDPSDKVTYSIVICESADYRPEEISFCGGREKGGPDCKDSEVELSASHKELITVEFENLSKREHFVRIKASVIHKGQMIKFVPYTVGYVGCVDVNENSRFWFNLIAVVLGIIALAVLWKILGKCGEWYKRGREKYCEEVKSKERKEKVE